MLIAHDEGKEIRPGVIVWSTLDEPVPQSHLSLDDGKRWPQYVDIEEPEDGKRVSRFYQLYCTMHNDQREEDNNLKISKARYMCIKETWSTATGKFLSSWEPDFHQVVKMHRGRMTCAEIEPYIRPLDQ